MLRQMLDCSLKFSSIVERPVWESQVTRPNVEDKTGTSEAFRVGDCHFFYLKVRGKKNSVIKYCLTGTSAASPPIPSMDFVLNIQTTGQVLPVAKVNITAVWQYLVLLAVVFFFSMLCAVIDPELSKVEARARTATRLPSVLRGVLAAAVRAAFTIIALFLVLSLNAGVLVAGLVGWALGFALTTNYFPLVGCIMAWCKARSRNHYVAKEGAAAEELDLIPDKPDAAMLVNQVRLNTLSGRVEGASNVALRSNFVAPRSHHLPYKPVQQPAGAGEELTPELFHSPSRERNYYEGNVSTFHSPPPGQIQRRAPAPKVATGAPHLQLLQLAGATVVQQGQPSQLLHKAPAVDAGNSANALPIAPSSDEVGKESLEARAESVEEPSVRFHATSPLKASEEAGTELQQQGEQAVLAQQLGLASPHLDENLSPQALNVQASAASPAAGEGEEGLLQSAKRPPPPVPLQVAASPALPPLPPMPIGAAGYQDMRIPMSLSMPDMRAPLSAQKLATHALSVGSRNWAEQTIGDTTDNVEII
eukprot:g25671.t1